MRSHLLLAALVSLSLSACLPASVEKSPPAIGRVTDARTHRPVVGARVSLPDLDVPGTTTDAQGRFSLAGQSKLGIVVLLPYDQPVRLVALEVQHEQYQPFRTTVPFHIYYERMPLDIALQPAH